MRRYVYLTFLGFWECWIRGYLWNRRLIISLVMLPKVRANEGNELQLNMYMSGPQSTNEGGSGGRVCELWMQRLCIE